MDIKKLREKTVKELQDELLAVGKEKFSLAMQKGIRPENYKVQLSRIAKKTIARIKTLLTEKTKGAEAEK